MCGVWQPWGMTKALIAVLFLAFSMPALARGYGGTGYHHVKGYSKKDGTYVSPHYAKNPKPKKAEK